MSSIPLEIKVDKRGLAAFSFNISGDNDSWITVESMTRSMLPKECSDGADVKFSV